MKNQEKIIFNNTQPSTSIVADILRISLEANASSIEIVRADKNFNVSYISTGMLTSFAVMTPEIYAGLVDRLKILANLKLLDEKNEQQSFFEPSILGKKIKVGVSILPDQGNEKIVMHLS